VAALIIGQLEDKKLNDAGNTLGEPEDDVEDDEVDEGDDIDSNDMVELEELLTGEGDEDEAVKPVRTAMTKVRSLDESAPTATLMRVLAPQNLLCCQELINSCPSRFLTVLTSHHA
jgi:hypothetical protein